jgi:hypothetical protein
MQLRFLPALLLMLAVLIAVCAAGDKKIPDSAPEMSQQTRMDLIKAFNAELIYIRTTFPVGSKGLQLKNGNITPRGSDLEHMLAMYGPAVKPGEQAMITDIRIKNDRIHFEINGGPIKKKKWYQRIQVGMGSGTVQAPDDPKANPRGSFVDVVFDRYVPELDPQQLKTLLRPVFDFDAKSVVEAYLETVPPKVKEAIQSHNVLVGMNREMVTYSLGRPPRKLREKEGDVDYEEWIYGEPPKDVQFVRLVGDEVTRVEIMKVGGEKILRTEKEVDLGTAPTVAKAPDEPAVRPANAPTLRRPGEAADSDPKTEDAHPHAPGRTSPSADPSGSRIPNYSSGRTQSIQIIPSDPGL